MRVVTTSRAQAPSARATLTADLVGDQQQPWDVFIRACPESGFCHLWSWRGIMSDVLGHECLNVVALDRDGAWRGVLPLVHLRSAVFGRYLISMPFLNTGGPVGSREARALLASWAVDQARRRGVDFLELRVWTPLDSGLHESHRKITLTLDLPPAAEVLWQTLPAKLKNQIRPPGEIRCEVTFGREQLDAYYRVFARQLRDPGTPVLPLVFFEAIASSFRDSVLFGTVHRKGEPLATGCGFFWDGVFELIWAAALREHHSDAPNTLLYWSFMEQAIARGARRFDFGRCTPGSDTHRFKQQWGGHDIRLPWAQWSPTGVATPPAPERSRDAMLA